MSKKRILSVLALMFVMALLFCFTACDESINENINGSTENPPSESGEVPNNNGGDESNNQEHTHTFSVWNTTTLPSCTAQGMQTRTCSSCGFSEYSPIAALGHTEVVDQAVAATCTLDGKTEGKHCSVCTTVLVAQNTIQSLGHQYNNGEVVTKATCNQDGTKKFTCTVATCRHSYTEPYSLSTYTATELYNQSVKYVGEITTYDKSGTELALGTGFVISSDGRIVTNYHVIEGAYSADITINNTRYTISSVLAYDANIDLAVLKINATGLTAATVCKKPVSVGATVYAIGSSRGMTNTYSQGIITYADRIVDGVSHVQHDASITHGNSGGPLINVYGEVIGINTWGISDSQNLNFAVFADELDNLVYGAPKTLSELYELNNNAFDILVDFILTNGEQNGDRVELVIENSSSEITIFDYNLDDGVIFLNTMAFSSSSDSSFFTAIVLEKDVNSYWYTASRDVDGVLMNKMMGYIEFKTFTKNSLVGYYSYEGLTSQESIMREETSEFAIYLIEVLEWLSTNYLGLTIADFGFESF